MLVGAPCPQMAPIWSNFEPHHVRPSVDRRAASAADGAGSGPAQPMLLATLNDDVQVELYLNVMRCHEPSGSFQASPFQVPHRPGRAYCECLMLVPGRCKVIVMFSPFSGLLAYPCLKTCL